MIVVVAMVKGGVVLESQLATLLQSLATGLLVFTSVIGAFLSVHYGNCYTALSQSYHKVINLAKEVLDVDGSRESLIRNARLVDDILSTYSYNLIAINNVLSQRMKCSAKWILIASTILWTVSLIIILKYDEELNIYEVLRTNFSAHIAIACLIAVIVIFMKYCWMPLFRDTTMFKEFPNIRERLDVSKDIDMFDVVI